MRLTFILPILYIALATISLSILQSIAPDLTFSQIINFVLGAAVFATVSIISFSNWEKYHWWSYSAMVFFLALTFLLGIERGGATRWLSFAGLNFQPSQIAIPLTIVTLAQVYSQKKVAHLKSFGQYALICLIPWALIFFQPNLGTSIVFLFSVGALLWQTDISFKSYFLLIGFTLIVSVIGWVFFMKDYQKQRVLSFINPAQHQESSYNARQSMIAVGSGQLTGRGLGHGIQSQLRFLPERQTDFIFASLAEELGLIGAGFLLCLFAMLLAVINYVLMIAKQPFIVLMISGLQALFTIQILINLGMNMGITPITGITLPLVSYGGSSILGFSLCFGLIHRSIIEINKDSVYQIR